MPLGGLFLNRLIFMFTLPKLVCEKLKAEKKRMSEVYLIVQGKQSERGIETRRERIQREKEEKRKKKRREKRRESSSSNLKEYSSILKGHL